MTEIRKENEGKTICVAVGRHTEYKGFIYLVQTSKLLDDSFRFYIAGIGKQKNYIGRRQEILRLVFVGQIDDTELKALVLVSDIFDTHQLQRMRLLVCTGGINTARREGIELLKTFCQHSIVNI